MLNLITIDRIFEESWKTYTDDNPFESRDFIIIYLEGLKKEVSTRTERTLPKLDSFVDAVKPLVEEGKINVSSNGFDVAFPDQTFSVIERKPGWFIMNALKCHFSADITVWKPEEAALLMWAAGSYRKKAGKRWNEFHKARKEQERIMEIEADYKWRRKDLVEQYSEALASGKPTDMFQDKFMSLLLNTADKKRLSLTKEETDDALKLFVKDAEKEKNAILRRKKANEKAREKRALEKENKEKQFNTELQHLTEAVGMAPVVTKRVKWSGHHFTEYRYPLSNGQTFSIRDYYKSPAQVEKVATTVMRELGMMIPYLASKYRTTADDWPSTPAMIRYYNQKAMDALGEDSPLRPLIEAFEAPVNKVSFHASARFLSIQYYFKKGERQCLRFALPRDLEPVKVEGFMEHFKEFVRYDKAMRRGGQILDYGFDVPEKTR